MRGVFHNFKINVFVKFSRFIIAPLDDDHLKHRYLTRNIIGNNKQVQSLEVVQVDNLKKTYNTVRSLENYKWWGSGYSIRSNKKACFPYRKAGKTYYFDIGKIYSTI